MTSEQLRAFIKKHHFTNDGLADLLGVTEMAVIHWLGGTRSVSLTTSRLLRLFDRHPELIKEFKG